MCRLLDNSLENLQKLTIYRKFSHLNIRWKMFILRGVTVLIRKNRVMTFCIFKIIDSWIYLNFQEKNFHEFSKMLNKCWIIYINQPKRPMASKQDQCRLLKPRMIIKAVVKFSTDLAISNRPYVVNPWLFEMFFIL